MTAGHCLRSNGEEDPFDSLASSFHIGRIYFLLSLAHCSPTASAVVAIQERGSVSQEEKKNRTPTDWQWRASVRKGELVWNCVWAHGKGDGCLSRERLSLGTASSRKPSFLFSIRTELKLYIGPNHLQRETTGGKYNPVPNTKVQITFLSPKHTEFHDLLPLPADFTIHISTMKHSAHQINYLVSLVPFICFCFFY